MAKDIDLIVEQPLTGERLVVQVKSKADQRVVNDYARRLGERATGERRMLICHSPIGLLEPVTTADGQRLDLMLGADLADRCIATGLTRWIIERAV